MGVDIKSTFSGRRLGSLAMLSVTLLLFAIASAWFWHGISQPFRAFEGVEAFVLVPKGASVDRIGVLLEDSGIIRSRWFFRCLVHLRGLSGELRAGEYQFTQAASLRDVIEKLRRGQVYLHRVTVPEGLDMSEVTSVIVAAGFGTPEEVLREMQNTSLIAELDPQARNLEGYLFPDTYFHARDASAAEIVQAMVQNFKRNWPDPGRTRLKALGLSVREVVTLASLIEEETALAEERSLVSAVFHNRLRLGMKLACDPTVIYAVKTIKEYDGVINRSDLAIDSPYNTYLYPGLPPGPIANPGLRSIEAALNPADTDYLYFVSRNDGSHSFSSRYADHSAAVRRYQR